MTLETPRFPEIHSDHLFVSKALHVQGEEMHDVEEAYEVRKRTHVKMAAGHGENLGK